MPWPRLAPYLFALHANRVRVDLSQIRLGPVVALDAASTSPTAAADTKPAKWVHCAYTGHFKGHAAGEFVFDDATFAEVIANFRSHPRYKPGAELAAAELVEAGNFDVIPWDFEHASEAPPNTGTVPVAGVPAQGWVLELQTRKGTGPDGEAVTELWALTRWLEPLKSYVAAKKYNSCSVVVQFGCRDPETGENLGAYLVSIAATNDPFLQGLKPLQIAAHRAGQQRIGASAAYVLADMRYLFGLPEISTMDEVLGELGKLQAIVDGQVPAPEGVDVARMVERLRSILQLPALTMAPQVLAEAGKLAAALAAETAASATVASTAGIARSAPDAQSLERNRTMDLAKLCLALCSVLGIPESSTPERIVELTRVKLEGGADAKKKLEAILKAVGVADSDAAIAGIADMCSKVDMLREAMPELAELRASADAAEEKKADEDVEKAMAAHRIPPTMKAALLFMRTGGVELADMQPAKGATAADVARCNANRAARKLAAERFAKQYPVTDERAAVQRQAQTAHLGRSFFAGPEMQRSPAVQLTAVQAGQLPPGIVAELQPAHPEPILGSHALVDLTPYAGNPTEKALAHLRATQPEKFAKMSLPERFYAARQVLKAARTLKPG